MKVVYRSIAEFKLDSEWQILMDTEKIMEYHEPGYTISRLDCSTRQLDEKELEKSSIPDKRVNQAAFVVTLSDLKAIDWSDADTKESHVGSEEYKMSDRNLKKLKEVEDDREFLDRLCSRYRLVGDEFDRHRELGTLSSNLEQKKAKSEGCDLIFELEELREMADGTVLETESGRYSLKPARVKDMTSETFMQVYRLMKKAERNTDDLDEENIRIVYSGFP